MGERFSNAGGRMLGSGYQTDRIGAGIAAECNQNDCAKQQGEGIMPKQDSLEAAHVALKEHQEHVALAESQSLMLRMVMPAWQANMNQLAEGMFKWFRHQGFWPKGWNNGGVADEGYLALKKAEKIALIHSELSEMLEAVRKGDRYNEGEELADSLVRILDYAGGFNIDLGMHFERKMLKNYQRPHRHNKAF